MAMKKKTMTPWVNLDEVVRLIEHLEFIYSEIEEGVVMEDQTVEHLLDRVLDLPTKELSNE